MSLRATRMRIATPTMLGDLTTALATATTRAMATTVREILCDIIFVGTMVA